MHRNSKVWVVDDDSSIRWVLERALNQAGIDNESFADGDQLLRRIASEQPDVIISDIRMPGTDGLELLSRISREHPDLTLRPVSRFIKMYVLRRGFLDGYHGAVLCGLAAFSVFTKYAKLWNIDRLAKGGPERPPE